MSRSLGTSFLWLGLVALLSPAASAAAAQRPNVLIVITDDQGHGDLGIHGNPVIKTPHLDRFAREGLRLTRFQSAPVCAPTRASLMTGRYNYRTGVTDTYLGRAMMHTDEVTLAEMLSAAGYRTAIFGKWHLGDNVPMRPIDQGFQEALVLKGGGIGQPSDPPGGSRYFDPLLQHNGKLESRKGYCSDVFTDAALDFISDRDRAEPFLVYLAFNAPHAPLELPESYRKPYAAADLSNARFPLGGYPLPGPAPKDVTARVYGMVTNIDDNIGRLLDRLESNGQANDTLVIFLTDNGPQQVRYVNGFRGRKATVYEGGIRVPCVLRWPGKLGPGKTIDRIASVIDLTPTVLEACGVARPAEVAFDGVSLWPLLTGRVATADWPDRILFTQWHRGNIPEPFRAFAARNQRFKLVRAETSRNEPRAPFELFDIEADPYEQHNLAAARPEIVDQLKAAYSAWFDDVSRTRGFDPPPRVHVGSPLENPTILTPQDWRLPNDTTRADLPGDWDLEVVRPGTYDVTLAIKPAAVDRVARLNLRDQSREARVRAGAETAKFEGIPLGTGPCRLVARVVHEDELLGVKSVEITRIDATK